MTQMSEPHAVSHPDLAPNCATSQGDERLAHGVHEPSALVVVRLFVASFALALACGGCVIPPSLSVGEDAGVNSPPAILAVRDDVQELPEPGPVPFERGRSTNPLSLTLLDTDLADTLYVRMFLDYTVAAAVPARVTCTAKPPDPPSPQRTVACEASSLCPSSGTDFNLSIVVFDREPLESGTPQYQAMPPGGLKTSVFYFLKCQGTSQ
jgi:hypothetical protein